MADVVEGGDHALAADLDQLLEFCRISLPPPHFRVVQQQRDVLLHNGLVDPELIRSYSRQELLSFQLMPGAVAALKSLFPSPGALQCTCSCCTAPAARKSCAPSCNPCAPRARGLDYFRAAGSPAGPSCTLVAALSGYLWLVCAALPVPAHACILPWPV